MKIVSINPKNPQSEIIAKAVKLLQQGGVVVHPTETCYGFAVDVFNQEALQDLYVAKGRDFKKPVSMMVRNLDEAKKYAEFNEVALRLAERFWPGPVTLVLPKKVARKEDQNFDEHVRQPLAEKTLPTFFNEGQVNVGVRCPDSEISQMLIAGFGGPLTTTSANLAGEPEAYTVADFLKQYKGALQESEKIALVLDGGELGLSESGVSVSESGAGVLKNPPSTIIGFENGHAVILREGAKISEVKEFLKN
jgi:L-threonylcarbamoyladenylate synthase